MGVIRLWVLTSTTKQNGFLACPQRSTICFINIVVLYRYGYTINIQKDVQQIQLYWFKIKLQVLFFFNISITVVTKQTITYNCIQTNHTRNQKDKKEYREYLYSCNPHNEIQNNTPQSSHANYTITYWST